MKLQILIPQYKETQEILKPMLDSIMIQQGVNLDDIGVIITNDGSDTIIPDEFFESYPYRIDYYLFNHQGVSGTRNFCFDRAEADYVMFCDADDMFLSAGGLYIILEEIKKGEFDCLIPVFSEECKDNNGNSIFINHNNDATFVHGKVYRRQYLIDKNIRWNLILTVHEDSYFNYLCRVCTTPDRIRECKQVYYLWKHRPDSICRTDKKWVLKTYDKMILSTSCLLDELIKRGLLNRAKEISCNFTYDSYFTLNKDEWCSEENKEFREQFFKVFAIFYTKFWPVAELLTEQERNQIIINSRNKSIANGGVAMEKFTFDQFVEEVKSYC